MVTEADLDCADAARANSREEQRLRDENRKLRSELSRCHLTLLRVYNHTLAQGLALSLLQDTRDIVRTNHPDLFEDDDDYPATELECRSCCCRWTQTSTGLRLADPGYTPGTCCDGGPDRLSLLAPVDATKEQMP